MSAPKVNYHVTSKDKGDSRLTRDKAYKVAMIQKIRGEGRKRVYVEAEGERVLLWASQVKALPRYKACESEKHKTPPLDKEGNPRPCPR